MATIGKAILNSTLLSRAQTRRWLKPLSGTANLKLSVGAPWEIFRAEVGGRTVDLYTKNGGIGSYASLSVLVPDYNFGFTFLTASLLGEAVSSPLVYFMSEMLAATVLPVLEEVARDQAKATFAGHYAASNLNSSLTITVDDQPGLRVTEWISNGTDVFDAVGLSSPGTYVDFRLQPNQLYAGDKIGFTGTRRTLPKQIYTGPLDLNCFTWGDTGITYGNVDLENFVFEIDHKTGKSVRVQPKALRISLERKT
jgi:hypothetical protein